MASAAYMQKSGADWIRGDRCEYSTFIWFAEGTEKNFSQTKEARFEFHFRHYDECDGVGFFVPGPGHGRSGFGSGCSGNFRLVGI